MKKLLLVIALLFAFPVSASTIAEGAIVKTANNPDVYIVKYNAGKQYKRLVLNPLVFESYGHLKWENLLTISESEMNSFVTADLVRVDGTTDVYQLYPEGDEGGKFRLASTVGYDMDSVYTINSTDFGNYTLRENKILAIYELANTVLFVSEVPTLSSFYSWGTPQYKTESYLGYGNITSSGQHGTIITKGMGYQIKLNNETVPLLSESYYFRGNRAVIDSAVCPYEQYVNNECEFEEKF